MPPLCISHVRDTVDTEIIFHLINYYQTAWHHALIWNISYLGDNMKECLNYFPPIFKAHKGMILKIHLSWTDGCRACKSNQINQSQIRFYKYLCITVFLCHFYKMFLWWQLYWCWSYFSLDFQITITLFAFRVLPIIIFLPIIMTCIISLSFAVSYLGFFP